MKIDVNLLLTIVGMVIGLVIGLWANKNGSNELKNQESEAIKRTAYNDGQIDSKLVSISDTVSRIDTNVENLKKNINNVEARLAKVEESTKSAHYRLDRLSDNEEKEKAIQWHRKIKRQRTNALLQSGWKKTT